MAGANRNRNIKVTMSWNWQQGLKSAGGGAMAGGALGGPMGAVVGGGLGLLGGFFGNEEGSGAADQRKMMMDYYNQIGGGRTAPQAGPAAQSAYSGFRANQQGLISRLEAMANGQGPSLARQQFEQATDRNMRGQQAMAASGRGGPLSQLTAANNMAMLGANAAQGSAMARTNEQMQAIGQLGGVIGQGRQADEMTNQFNAQSQNDVALQNLRARLDTMQLDDQTKLGILNQFSGLNNTQTTVQNQPGFGDQMLAGGAGLFAMHAAQRGPRGMSPIASGNPGQGGYYTPSPTQGRGNGLINPWKPGY